MLNIVFSKARKNELVLGVIRIICSVLIVVEKEIGYQLVDKLLLQ